MAGGFAADKHPVLATDRHWTHRPFGRVVIDRQITVFEIAIKRGPLVERIRGRFPGQALRKKDFRIKSCLQIVQQGA